MATSLCAQPPPSWVPPDDLATYSAQVIDGVPVVAIGRHPRCDHRFAKRRTGRPSRRCRITRDTATDHPRDTTSPGDATETNGSPSSGSGARTGRAMSGPADPAAELVHPAPPAR
ncbi:hypothetical protein BOX37_24770 [Nocardia mangyaensis]|uniref:Uncharacterized protein n=1 Tax=Nocardia mangyaensis TaxID=2213200 RepID=A0A1J0VX33_9NOCA|nr:hypothetical protein BOX37_24770 [Nocardia mangyaensis]